MRRTRRPPPTTRPAARIAPRLPGGGRAWKACLWAIVVVGGGVAARGQEEPAIGPDRRPVLRLDGPGPTSFVSSLAFNPAGTTLYAGGWDKIVRTWAVDGPRPRLDPTVTYRVPVGPGLSGAVNAIAVSPDGRWLAVGGLAVVRGASDLWSPGWKLPTAGTLTDDMRLDQGVIHVFDTATGEARVLRGHRAAVVALAFTAPRPDAATVLISASLAVDDRQAAGENQGTIRAWDVARAASLGETSIGGAGNVRPGLAAWHTGREATDVSVAIAWPAAARDTPHRWHLWDVTAPEPRPVAGADLSMTAAIVPGQPERLIVAGLGRLSIWACGAGGKEAIGSERQLQFHRDDLPLAMAVVASQPARRGKDPPARDRLVVLLRRKEANSDTLRLAFVDLTSFARILGLEVPLGPWKENMPTLVASPAGDRIAVAGIERQDVAIYQAADLLAGKARALPLPSGGHSAASVGFVRREGRLGLALGSRPKTAGAAAPPSSPDDLILDPRAGRFVAAGEGWLPANATIPGWRARLATAEAPPTPGRTRIVLEGPGGAAGSVVLPPVPGRVVTDYAMLPPGGPGSVPLVVVASEWLRQPLLEIYDPVSGLRVRELSGHVAEIVCLAVSDDGRLLASTAADRTTCVWWLRDLATVVGRRGGLEGVELRAEEGAFTVGRVDPDATNRDRLAPGDRLVSWEPAGGVEPLPALVDFYLKLSRLPPQTAVRFSRRRADSPDEAIDLVLTQGCDERKPLLSLFLNDARGKGWVAWNPLGPYESSHEHMDALFGWHTNTGDAATPVRFTAAREYADLRRPGLVESLLETGELRVPKPPPLERPEMGLRFRTPTGQSLVIADSAPAPFHARTGTMVFEPLGLKPDAIAGVSWQLGDQPPQPMQPDDRLVWSAAPADWFPSGQKTTLRIMLETGEDEPQTFTREVSLEYHPPPPRIVWSDVPEKTTQSRLPLRVEIVSTESPPGEVVGELTVLAKGDRALRKAFRGDRSVVLEEPLDLVPGDTVIAIAAGPTGDERFPRTHESRRIVFNELPVDPPTLVATVAVDGAADAHPLGAEEGPPLVIREPRLRLAGKISAATPLTTATWAVDDRSSTLKSPDDFSETIELSPGDHTIRVAAQARRSQPTSVAVKVRYVPAVPAARLVEPAGDLEWVEGRDGITSSSRLRVIAEAAAGTKHPVEAVVLVNGRPAGPPRGLQDGRFEASIDLPDRDQRVAVRFSNAWGGRSTSDEVTVRRLRPPLIREIHLPARVEEPLVDVVLDVDSPSGQPLLGLEVNGLALPLGTVEREGQAARFRVVARGVPLVNGVNTLRPRVRNADGWSTDTTTGEVELVVPPPPPATIVFDVDEEQTTDERDFDVKFIVTSLSPLSRVELHADGQPLRSFAVDDLEPIPGDPRARRLTCAAVTRLKQGVNRLRATATNAGGLQVAEATVCYVPKPVSVAIRGLRSLRAGDEPLAGVVTEGGKLAFPKAASDGKLQIFGRIVWPDDETAARHRNARVNVWVNGLLQQPARVSPPVVQGAELESSWATIVRLTEGSENVLRVHLADGPQSVGAAQEVRIACENPNRNDQRLHLLVIGEGLSAIDLERLALAAVGGRRADAGADRIRTPVFADGWIYTVTDTDRRPLVLEHLRTIRSRAADPDASDIVLIYYRGAEHVDADGRFFLVSPTVTQPTSGPYPASRISSDDLMKHLGGVAGAQLFLFDTQRQATESVSTLQRTRWPGKPHMAALRYSWTMQGRVPDDARLLTAFERAVRQPGPRSLGQIEDDVFLDATRASGRYPALLYEPQVPESLENLVLAGP